MSLHETAEKLPKMKKMFEAITALILEGADINTMKVSDITARAAIGKGTAYEYFKSKDELIVKAVLYELETLLQEVEDSIKACRSFRERYICILNWLEENFSGRNSITLFMNMYQGAYQISATLKAEMMNQTHGFECMLEHSRELLMEGIRDGELRDDLPLNMMCAVLVSSFSSLIIFLNQEMKQKAKIKEASIEQLKQLLTESLFATLGR